jgi:ribosome-associated protein
MTEQLELLQSAARAALSKKAENPILLDLSGLSSFTDAFLLCHGNNERQVRAITDAVDEALRSEHGRKARVEGYDDAGWVLMDYGDVVIHVFTREKRDFFDLEHLWGDAPRFEVDDDGPDAARTV